MKQEYIYNLTLPELIIFSEKEGYTKGNALALWKNLYRNKVESWAECVNVNEKYLTVIKKQYSLQLPQVKIKRIATDKTIKFLLELSDGNLIESVLMHNKYGMSLCITSQVGCNMGCSFCASGLLGKKRDLMVGEFISQIMVANQYIKKNIASAKVVTNVVIMGIGEPFDNYENFKKAVTILKEENGLAIASRKITVSTSGLSPQIINFVNDNININLAISLHAPNDEMRSKIMKVNKVYDIKNLMGAVDYYLERSNKRITFEYILFKNINDNLECARELAKLIGSRTKKISVNLIPYNEVDEFSQYQRSLKETVLKFYDELKKNCINVSIRLEYGRNTYLASIYCNWLLRNCPQAASISLPYSKRILTLIQFFLSSS